MKGRMSARRIEKLLRHALLHDGEMQRALYDHELAGVVDELKDSLAQDNDDYIFTVTENRGHVAMVLIEKTGQLHINEEAREKLKAFWPAAYESNMKTLIPVFAQQLQAGELPINGVKIARSRSDVDKHAEKGQGEKRHVRPRSQEHPVGTERE